MTPLKRAQKILGKYATVSRRFLTAELNRKGDMVCRCYRKDCPGMHWWCSVGHVEQILGMFNMIEGEGETWGEAFVRVEDNRSRRRSAPREAR